ncbi:MAG: LuxR family transcriptional regulator [Acidobacteria bacterium]|jgi:RNA polymerase sigma factor (sigma-70 family)|nr:LuxR family transcriptional regulator [Acidobacteriota bacterium]
MNDVLKKHNSLMERIVREHGTMIRSAVHKAMGNIPWAEDIVSEVHFAVFTTLRKLGDGWTPPRSFVRSVIQNKVNDFLWQKYWDSDDVEAFKKHQAEQARQREEAMSCVHGLTQSEFKVFRLLGLGLTNQEIAESLFISPLTVRTHVKRIHAKCGIQGRAKLALTAYQACYRELGEGQEAGAGAGAAAGAGAGLPAPEAAMFARRGLLAQQAS